MVTYTWLLKQYLTLTWPQVSLSNDLAISSLLEKLHHLHVLRLKNAKNFQIFIKYLLPVANNVLLIHSILYTALNSKFISFLP